MRTNDSQAIGAVLQGDRSSYQMLVEKHKKMVYGIAWSHLGNSDLSEDAAQETFIKAYTYLGTLREPDKFQGWLAKIARNVCRSLGRRTKRENAFRQRLAVVESAEAEPHADERESLTQQLWEAFADLPALHREALTIFYIEGKSVDEAAAAIGITETALKTRLHRARVALRQQLEQKLEDELADLQPSKDFTRSVLVLIPLSPKGAIGAGGGALAIFGKLFASLSFALWISAASTLPTVGLFMLYSKLDEASLKDSPENQPVKALIRRGYLKAVAAMFATFVVVWLLIPHFEPKTLCQIISVLYAYTTWRASKALRVNTSPSVIGGVLVWAIMLVAFAAIGFFRASILLFPVAVMSVVIVAAFTTQKTPLRMGYNLFMHSAIGGYGDVPVDNQPLGRRLTRTELRAFAKFLGELWLLQDYKFRGDGISLILHPMQKTVAGAFGLAAASEVAISSDGTCTATISAADMRATRQITRTSAEAAELQDQACRVFRYALSGFLRGDLDAARSVLAPDQAAFAQNPCSARHNYVKSLVTILLGVVVLVEFLMPSILGLIIAGAGFLAAMLVLAITLRITRRQQRRQTPSP